MSFIYIHESIITDTSNKSNNTISLLDKKENVNPNYYDISFCNLQSVNDYLNAQLVQFSETFSNNRNATIVHPKTGSAKTMQQRYLDLVTMFMMFNGILSEISVSMYGKDYLELEKIQRKNIELRQTMNTELDELYGNDPNDIFKKAQLDSTIYSSILWVILAILLIYYIFIRIDE